MKIYEDLMKLNAVSGNEKQVRDYFLNYLKDYPNYEVKMDNLGSVFAIKKSKNKNAKTVMIAGHMDEVGFMVSAITKNGHLKLQPLGGFKTEVLLSQIMEVTLDSGEVLKGVIGSLPPHIKDSNSAKISDLLLDVGATSREEAIEFGIKVGQMVTFPANYTKTKNNNRIISKAIDNRFGCALALEAINHFDQIDLDVNIIIGATVQEEVGLRGAQTSVNLFHPDVFIALDASPVNDLENTEISLGKGFLMRLYDPRNIMHQGLLKFFRNIAKTNNISYQNFQSLGGTDAAKALDSLDGVLATTIGLPARYIHSSAAMLDTFDVLSAKNMLFNVVSSLNNQTIEKIKGGFND